MPKSAHIICAKCGSEEVKFKINTEDYADAEACGVFLFCTNCGELTSVEELNEQLHEHRGWAGFLNKKN